MAASKPFCLGDRLSPINTNEIQTGRKLYGHSSADCHILLYGYSVWELVLSVPFGLFLPRFSFSLIVLVQSPSLGSFLLLVGIALDPSSSHFFTPYISALIPSPLFCLFSLWQFYKLNSTHLYKYWPFKSTLAPAIFHPPSLPLLYLSFCCFQSLSFALYPNVCISLKKGEIREVVIG